MDAVKEKRYYGWYTVMVCDYLMRWFIPPHPPDPSYNFNHAGARLQPVTLVIKVNLYLYWVH